MPANGRWDLIRRLKLNLCSGQEECVSEFSICMAIIESTYKGIFPGAKRPASETDRSTQTSSEVKNEWSYAFTPTYVFMACTYRYKFTFIFTLAKLCV